jgi:cytochrome c-type biogenesis protein CcmH/NrfF
VLAAAATLITSHSHLLLAHLREYGQLAQAESELAAQQWLARTIWALVGLGSAVVALTLGGVALMLGITTTPATTAGIVVLWAVPALPALIALVAAMRAQRTSAPAFRALRDQIERDLQLLSNEELRNGRPDH